MVHYNSHLVQPQGFFLRVVTGYKGRHKAMEAKFSQLLERSSEVGYIARIPASITIAIEERGPREGN